jgi:hypothetical protein
MSVIDYLTDQEVEAMKAKLMEEQIMSFKLSPYSNYFGPKFFKNSAQKASFLVQIIADYFAIGNDVTTQLAKALQKQDSEVLKNLQETLQKASNPKENE